MAITNQQAITFTNAVVRPMAARFRALKAEVDSALTTWNAGLSSEFPSDPAEIVEDNREAEGISRVSGNDVQLLMAQLVIFQTQLNQAGVGNVIAKPCVRPLQVIQEA